MKIMSEINPNNLTFKQGLERIDEAAQRAGLKIGNEIITSRDERAMKAQEFLETKNVPQGFKKWQLPVAMRCESQLFITVAPPGAKVPQHSHDEGPGVRFIASGSIRYKGHELTTGDWMYIPAGVPYEFEVGPYGATMCYCYCCCCA
jgi:hypothetical protein